MTSICIPERLLGTVYILMTVKLKLITTIRQGWLLLNSTHHYSVKTHRNLKSVFTDVKFHMWIRNFTAFNFEDTGLGGEYV